MKHTRAGPLLSRELLCFVRDGAPTADDFAARFAAQALHVLRKAGAVVVEGEQVRLSRRHLSPDGGRFVWGKRLFLLGRDEVLLVRWGPQGPPAFAADA